MVVKRRTRICRTCDRQARRSIDLGVGLPGGIPNTIMILPLVCLLSSACRAPEPEPNGSEPASDAVEFTLEVARSLETERPWYRREIAGAGHEVIAWFDQAGYKLTQQELIDRAVVFDDPTEAKKSLAEAFEVKPEDIPDTFAGTVGGRTLYLISRELYRPTWVKLYSDWPWTQGTYHSLVVHELAHRAHELVAVTHFGTADAMGPTWFFEGLAVTCAGQFDDRAPLMTREEIEQYVGGGKTPPVSYPLYGRLFRSLARDFRLTQLIEQASADGFPVTLWTTG